MQNQGEPASRTRPQVCQGEGEEAGAQERHIWEGGEGSLPGGAEGVSYHHKKGQIEIRGIKLGVTICPDFTIHVQVFTTCYRCDVHPTIHPQALVRSAG